MGPPSYMRSVVDRNVFVRRIPVFTFYTFWVSSLTNLIKVSENVLYIVRRVLHQCCWGFGFLERYALPTPKATYHSTRCNIPQGFNLQVCKLIYQYFNWLFSFTVDETDIALSHMQETTQNAPWQYMLATLKVQRSHFPSSFIPSHRQYHSHLYLNICTGPSPSRVTPRLWSGTNNVNLATHSAFHPLSVNFLVNISYSYWRSFCERDRVYPSPEQEIKKYCSRSISLISKNVESILFCITTRSVQWRRMFSLQLVKCDAIRTYVKKEFDCTDLGNLFRLSSGGGGILLTWFSRGFSWWWVTRNSYT